MTVEQLLSECNLVRLTEENAIGTGKRLTERTMEVG